MKPLKTRRDATARARSLGRCKVCAKLVRAWEDHVNVFYAGTNHLVCCASCAAKFKAHPSQYLVS